jgi:putative ABC transport system permease protein
MKIISEPPLFAGKNSYFVLLIEESFASLRLNKMRAFLTALGIVFGVAAVISMMAIGNGARKEILDQLKEVGTNNIIVEAKVEQNANPIQNKDKKNGNQQKLFSYGLRLADASAIKELPDVQSVCPYIQTSVTANARSRSLPIQLIGTNHDYFHLFHLNFQKGNAFNSTHENNNIPVCVIGDGVKNRLFPSQFPLNAKIRCGDRWYCVIGVLEKKSLSAGNAKINYLNETDQSVYIPVGLFLQNHGDRSLVLSGFLRFFSPDNNYHQLDRLFINIHRNDKLEEISAVVNKMLFRRHSQTNDYNVVVPELLLKQQQKTKNIFNIVLGVIAGISLLVGGIGIMNIMFVTVLERTREIGIRMSVGATSRDIIMQFLLEAVLICLSGGIIGVILGIALSFSIEWMTQIKTIISITSILLSFGISVTVGLFFGYLPARRAAEQLPVKSLQYQNG